MWTFIVDCLPGDLVAVNTVRTILVVQVGRELLASDGDNIVPVFYVDGGRFYNTWFSALKKVKRINT